MEASDHLAHLQRRILAYLGYRWEDLWLLGQKIPEILCNLVISSLESSRVSAMLGMAILGYLHMAWPMCQKVKKRKSSEFAEQL